MHEYFMKLMYFVSVVSSIAILRRRRTAAKRLGAILLHTLLIQRIAKPKMSRYTTYIRILITNPRGIRQRVFNHMYLLIAININ